MKSLQLPLVLVLVLAVAVANSIADAFSPVLVASRSAFVPPARAAASRTATTLSMAAERTYIMVRQSRSFVEVIEDRRSRGRRGNESARAASNPR
jgi:hypothetical protein